MTAPPGRLVVRCGAVPIALAALLCLWQPPLLARLELAVYDRLVRMTGARPPSGRVVIVDVDEQSLSTIGQWPWSRTVIADLITRLRDLGASTVALDIMFAEEERLETGGVNPDAVLASVVREGRVVLGYALTFDAEPLTASETCLAHPLNLAVIHAAGDDAAESFFRATRAICNRPILTSAATASGFLNAAPDADGVLRRVPLVVEFNGSVYPSLALAAVAQVSGFDAAALRVSNVNTASLVLQDQTGRTGANTGLTVPVDGKSNLVARFRGGKRTFTYVSAADVLNGGTRRSVIEHKIVFVGTTALGTREVVATPLDTLFTGVEVQATAADNLLQQDFLYRPEHAVAIETFVVLVAGIAAIFLVRTLGVAAGALAVVIMGVGVWSGSMLLMSTSGMILSPLITTVGLGAALAAMTTAGLTVESRRARRADEAQAASKRLMVQTLLSLVETRDAETGSHSRRTQRYTRLLAEELARHPRFRAELTPARIDLLSVLAPLHDIGKVAIPDRVLHKPGPLDKEELDLMRKHPVYGRDVIVNAERAAGVRDDETLRIAKEIVYTHHERWDGSGYPQGLRGTAIPVAGRVVAIVDVYDAMHSPRPYHRAMSHDEVMAIIVEGRGTHFDPDVVDACVRIAPIWQQLSEAENAASMTLAVGA